MENHVQSVGESSEGGGLVIERAEDAKKRAQTVDAASESEWWVFKRAEEARISAETKNRVAESDKRVEEVKKLA